MDEWQRVENKFKSAINTFDKIGWIDKRSGQNEELLFEIRPAIHRMAKLYETELQDFDQFTKNLRDNGQLWTFQEYILSRQSEYENTTSMIICSIRQERIL